MKVTEQGVGEVRLDKRQFKARGGEGDIYVSKSKNKVYKICHPGMMIPKSKISELQVLSGNPNFIIPRNILIDSKQEPIGYTMDFVDGDELCKYFTKSFKTDNNIRLRESLDLILKLRELVEYAHSHNILMVDMNEYNFLVGKNLRVYGIDTNSYQTPSFPAQAIMESIRDPHCGTDWSEETDWFSWGILAGQILLGIHLYKGGHPDYKKVPKAQRLVERMRNNVSIFNSQSTTPPGVPPLESLPRALKDWMVEVYENGERCAPPDNIEASRFIKSVAIRTIVGNVIQYALLKEFKEPIRRHNGFYNSVILASEEKQVVVQGPETGVETKVVLKDQELEFRMGTKAKSVNIDYTHVVKSGNHVYLTCGSKIYKAIIHDRIGLVSTKHVGNILDVPHATKRLDGGLIQNLLGECFVTTFDNLKCYNTALPEVKGKIVEGKYENGVLMLLTVVNNEHIRHVYHIDAGVVKRHRQETSNSYNPINFTVMDNGIAVCLNENHDIEIFTLAGTKIVDDDSLDNSYKLSNDGNSILLTIEDKLYRIKMS